MRADIRARLRERTFLTFGGNETYLLFREFCAFEVVNDDQVWERMEDELSRPIADAAAENGLGLLADCFVWRASSDYVGRLGAAGDGEVNRDAVRRTRDFLERWGSGDSARGAPWSCRGISARAGMVMRRPG